MNIIATVLIIIGLFFFTGGAVGIIRLPDFYSRLHPAGKLDTAGLVTMMSALALYTGSTLTLGDLITAFKIMLIFVFVFITSPTATHALVAAGIRAGLTPWSKETEIER